MKKILLLFIFTTLFSCSVDEDTSDAPALNFVTLPIEKVEGLPESFNFKEKYSFKVTYLLPNSCYKFYNLHLVEDGSEKIIAINAIVNGDEACTSAITEETYTFDFVIDSIDEYVFKFWKGKDDSGKDMYHVIRVPVALTN